jgi:hypothetical protein
LKVGLQELLKKREDLVAQHISAPEKLEKARTAFEVFNGELQTSFNKLSSVLQSLSGDSEVALYPIN